MYVSKVSVLKMNEVDMVFYAKFTDLVRLCLDPKFSERTSWKPYRREIVETLLKSALLGGEQHAAGGYAEGGVEFQYQRSFRQVPGDVAAERGEASAGGDISPSKLCITPKYLSIICKRHSGKTAIEWITEYTLADITYYLRSTSKTIKEISGILGFSNTSFFGKYVREHLHMSP